MNGTRHQGLTVAPVDGVLPCVVGLPEGDGEADALDSSRSCTFRRCLSSNPSGVDGLGVFVGSDDEVLLESCADEDPACWLLSSAWIRSVSVRDMALFVSIRVLRFGARIACHDCASLNCASVCS